MLENYNPECTTIIRDDYQTSVLNISGNPYTYKPLGGYFYFHNTRTHDEKNLRVRIEQLTGKKYPNDKLRELREKMDYLYVRPKHMFYISSDEIIKEHLEKTNYEALNIRLAKAHYLHTYEPRHGYYYIKNEDSSLTTI